MTDNESPPDLSRTRGEVKFMSTGWYDFVTWFLNIVIDLFFREVHPRGSWRIPKGGPVIFVAAPHANQFVDPALLMRIIKKEAGRRVAWLIAEKSMDRAVIGPTAKRVGAVPVARAMDSKKSKPGKIYLADPENDPLTIHGHGTNFDDPEFQKGAQLVLPTVQGGSASAEILEIVGPDELKLRKPFDSGIAVRQLTGQPLGELDGGPQEQTLEPFEGVSFKLAPKIDQGKVYRYVTECLGQAGCIGIFPEGGSHDRPDLLKLKAGVAIMALETLSKYPHCGIKIVPCGMNYFNAHKFRSRAVIEFGQPLSISQELVDKYKSGVSEDRKAAITSVMNDVFEALRSVTVLAPDYDTLMVIQAVRRLYKPKGKKIPLTLVVELNRRLIKGYDRYKNDPRIVKLKKSVMSYNRQLLDLQIRDHQVETANVSLITAVWLLVSRLVKISFLSIFVLPGAVLFAPVFITGKVVSNIKSKEALAASTVKLQGRDVIATWKVLISLGAAPTSYILYTIILTFWYARSNCSGYVSINLPTWLFSCLAFILLAATSYAALRFGEIGMDILKSLRPVTVALSPFHGRMLARLRNRREELAQQVTELINTLGPEVFPDFDRHRIISTEEQTEYKPETWDDTASATSEPTTPIGAGPGSPGSPTPNYRALSRNESLHDISTIGLFPSRPHTPHHPRSRSRSGSFGLSGGFGGRSVFGDTNKMFSMTPLENQGAMNEVHKKIQNGLRERGARRKSESYESGTSTPASEMDGLMMTKAKKDA